MVHVIPMTDEEKMAMYMKLSKKELATMLMNCNKMIEMIQPQVHYQPNPPGTWSDQNPIWQVMPEYLPVYTTSSGQS